MSVEKALSSIGATCVRTEDRGKQRILHVRIDPNAPELWAQVVRNFLISASGVERCRVDLSKNFFVDDDNVKFLWRIVLAGDISACEILLEESILTAVEPKAPPMKGELMSQPLVGRVEYELDPARGKIKGAHDPRQAVGLIATASRT
jgi:hypothetical protein